MKHLGVAVPVVFSFCMLVPMTGTGAPLWQTIQAAGDRSVTIDLPAAVGQQPSANLQGEDVMAFFAKSTNKTNVLCTLSRTEYTEDFTRRQWIAALASSKTGLLCGSSDSGSNFEMMDSKSTASNGSPAATCVSTYTTSDRKEPGKVHSRLTVAAPQALYSFTCEASDDSQAAAKITWNVGLNDEVAHMQASLHLADTKK